MFLIFEYFGLQYKTSLKWSCKTIFKLLIYLKIFVAIVLYTYFHGTNTLDLAWKPLLISDINFFHILQTEKNPATHKRVICCKKMREIRVRNVLYIRNKNQERTLRQALSVYLAKIIETVDETLRLPFLVHKSDRITPGFKSLAKCQNNRSRALKWGIVHLCSWITFRDRDWYKKLDWLKISPLLKNPQFFANPYETWIK